MNVKFSDIVAINDVLWSENEEGKVVISFLQNHWIQNLFRKYFRLKIPLQKDIVLDEKTSFIWKKIDGKRTVGEIFTMFNSHFGEEDSNDLEARFGTVIHHFLSQQWIKNNKDTSKS